MNNKKGISAVVATVLIILITVAAVTIIWAAIIPMINSQLNKGTVCLDAVSQISLSDKGYTCKDSADNTVSLQIKHDAKDFALKDVQVIFTAGGNSYSFYLSNDVTTVVPSGTTIPFPGSNEEKVYVIDTAGITDPIDSVEIAPIVAVGNTKETCSISASKVLVEC
jgi:flagellin-like protein